MVNLDSAKQALIQKDWTAFEKEYVSLPDADRKHFGEAIVKYALSSKHGIECLVSCLQNVSHAPAADMYIYIQDSVEYVNTVGRLLAAGLPPSYYPGWSETPLLTDAIESENVELLRLLLEEASLASLVDELKGRDPDQVPVVAGVSSPAILQMLVRAEARDTGDLLELHVAAMDGREEDIYRLLARGRPVDDIPNANHFALVGTTLESPLHYAAGNRHMGAVLALLDAGADATMRDRRGRSVLQNSMKDGLVWSDLREVLVEREIEI